jgi:hypothetical protein
VLRRKERAGREAEINRNNFSREFPQLIIAPKGEWRSDSLDTVEKCLGCRHGSNIGTNKIAAIGPSTLRELYENPAFVPSLTLDEIEPALR